MAIKKKIYVGRILGLWDVGTKINDIVLPSSEDITVIGAEDLNDKDIKFYESTLPLLATYQVQYPGQNVFAVFGKDQESVDTYCIKIQKPALSGIQPLFLDENLIASETLGSVDDTMLESPVKTKLLIHRHSYMPLSDQRVRAWKEDNKLYVEAASQWPALIRKSVASFTGLDPDDVVFVGLPFTNRFDEYLTSPVSAAILAAVMCNRTGIESQIVFSPQSIQPEIEFTIQSSCDSENRIKAVKAVAKADLGAYPILIKEYINSLIVGLVPVYNVENIQTDVFIYKSNNSPACFFSDLGYSMALAAVENHFSTVATQSNISPALWKLERTGRTSFSKKARRSELTKELSNMLKECTSVSFFDRLNFANTQSKIKKSLINPFVNYSRGVGIACGDGIGGFSSDFSHIEDFSLKLELTENNSANLVVGAMLGNKTKKALATIIHDKLGKTDITFDECVGDFGPSVLARKQVFIPMFLDKCCSKLIENPNADFSVVTADDFAQSKDCLFDSDSCGAISISLHIDPIKLIPVIDNVWCRFASGNRFDLTNNNMILRRVSAVINEICPCAANRFAIDTKTDNHSEINNSSLDSLIRGLVTAAFTSALSQALDYNIIKLPVRNRDILGIINKKHSGAQNET